MAGKIWCVFECDIDLARKWHLVVEALEAKVERGFRPETGIDTSEWTDADWEIWHLGGYVEIDSQTAGGVSFYRTERNTVIAYALGSSRIPQLFRAAGARKFSPRALVGDSRCSRIVVVSVETATSWFRCFEKPRLHNVWPEPSANHSRKYSFPTGTVSESGATFDVVSGLTINPATETFLGYVLIRAHSVSAMLSRRKLQRVADRIWSFNEQTAGCTGQPE